MRRELIAPGGKLRIFLENMERLVGSNQVKAGQGKYAAGDKLSIADIGLFTLLKMIRDGVFDGIPSSLLDEFPLLRRIHDIMIGLDCWGL